MKLMKKPLFSLICAVALLFSSCSKENTAAPKDEKLYPVTFNVSTFSKEIVPMASLKKTVRQISASTTSGNALSDAVKHVSYAVYNEAGIKVNEKVSNSQHASFGEIEDSLPVGKYTVMLLGSTLRTWNAPDNINGSYYMPEYGGGDDFFFSQTAIEVQGLAINQTIQLKRKVGKVEIKITDEIPANIEEIVYSVKGVGHYFFPYSGLSYINTIYKSNYYWVDEESGSPDYSQDFGLYFFLNYDQDAFASVNIRAYDRNRNLVVDKTINDVPVSINKKTILTGRLFDDAGSTKGQAFSISVDDKWNSESNHVEF